MSDSSKVDKKFYRHPKVLRARRSEPGAISLWLLANCFCRDHRRQGRLSRDEALELGTEAEIKALVDATLWREDGDWLEFKDWSEWHPDLVRNGVRPSAGRIVWEVLPAHPEVTRMRLAGEVEKLIEEDVCLSMITAALRKWGSRADAKPGWLPYFVSDVLREGNTGLPAAIKQARETGDMTPLKEFGFKWVSPDVPDGMRSVAKVRAYMREQKSLWLDNIEAGLSESTT